ncbi:hypothetical protein [Halochromatium roseum]|uniref:hypothetical protein n=1 Tax=Halochromatium roseum TaxID=391920 RepID=UPI001913551F|nr:hypothetical protein [Halochromatium roseum]MBK5940538.1 hypothetical protein [Halochromatium roseum]
MLSLTGELLLGTVAGPKRHRNELPDQPDKGWDYDPYAEPTGGLRRTIEGKRQKVDNRLMAAFETNADDALAAWPIRGLARRFPAKDLATLEVLLREYAYRLPGDLPHGVKFVREGGPNDDFYMATDGKGGFWFREIDYQGFNSRRDLFGGLAACAAQQAMTREEEYALESLWHEIWHNRQRGMDQAAKLPKEHLARLFAETLNQVVARLTYPRFIERLGGKAQHQAWVMGNGYGYAPLVRRFLRVTIALGLTTEALAGDLATINAQADLLFGTAIVSRLLAKKSGAAPARIQAALDLLDAREALFSAAVGAIKSPL